MTTVPTVVEAFFRSEVNVEGWDANREVYLSLPIFKITHPDRVSGAKSFRASTWFSWLGFRRPESKKKALQSVWEHCTS